MFWGVQGASGWLATVPGVYRWHEALVHGKLLPARQTALLRDATVEEAYGWHWRLRGRGDLPMFDKGGDFPGAQSQIIAYPSRNVVIVWASNDETRQWRSLLNEGISRIALGEDSVFMPPRVARVDSARKELLIGRYTGETGATIEIGSWDGALQIVAGDSVPREVLYFSAGRNFVGLPSSGVQPMTLEFEYGSDGRATRVHWTHGNVRRSWRR
jgi:hypothetical protein